MALQNILTIFDDVPLWTPDKSPILCSSSPLHIVCNDITTLSYTGTIILKEVSSSFK